MHRSLNTAVTVSKFAPESHNVSQSVSQSNY